MLLAVQPQLIHEYSENVLNEYDLAGIWSVSNGMLISQTAGDSGPDHSTALTDLTQYFSNWTLEPNLQNTWCGWIDLNRTTLSGWGSSSYAAGMILAADSSQANVSGTSGYAVVLRNSPDELVIIRFSDGLHGGSSNLPEGAVQIVSSGYEYDESDQGVNFFVRLHANGGWEISYLAGPQLAPEAAVLQSSYCDGTAVSTNPDAVCTGAQYRYAGWVYAHASGGGEEAWFDHLGAGISSGNAVPNPEDFQTGDYDSSEVEILWNTPDSQVSGILVFGAENQNVDIQLSGDGADYADANSDFPIAGEYGENRLVYNGPEDGLTVSGLTSECQYCFQAFAYSDTNWSSGSPQLCITASDPPVILITEISDPADAYTGRFVELTNTGGRNLDFDEESWVLALQSNGEDWVDIPLTGTVQCGESYILARSAAYFPVYYSQTADMYSGSINGNGNDGIFLYRDGDHASGTLIDSYGIQNEDGEGQVWEYTDSQVVRKIQITSPAADWTESEWSILPAETPHMSPGKHPSSNWLGSVSSDWQDADNWSAGAPDSLTHVVIQSSEIPAEISNPVFLKSLALQGADICFSQSGNLAVQDTIQLVAGCINTDSTHTLRLTDTGWIFGGNDSSFINGPLVKEFSPDTGEDLFRFAVGKQLDSASGYDGVELIPSAGSVWQAEYFSQGHPLSQPEYFYDVTNLSNQEYWRIQQISGNAVLDSLKLSWDEGSELCPQGMVDPSLLMVAQLNIQPGAGLWNMVALNGDWAGDPNSHGWVRSTVEHLNGIDYTFGYSSITLDENSQTVPIRTDLSPPNPNPFNAGTCISYSLAEPSSVKLQIFDLLGREVDNLVNANQSAGRYEIVWESNDSASGMYLVILQTNNEVLHQKLIHMK